MIANYTQPKSIKVDDNLYLVKYYPNYKVTLPWYSDLTLCKQVDNIDEPYTLERLKRMYHFLSKNGECYYIKVKENGRFHLCGDISLYHNEIGIAIATPYQNKHYGRKSVLAILNRAKQLNINKVEVEIYSFNTQSQNMFKSVGFQQIGKERYEINL